MRLPTLLLSVAGLAACTASEPVDTSTMAQTSTGGSTVSGYGFSGPTVLPSDRADVAMCAGVPPEMLACDRVQGTLLVANDCRLLCSKPIAPLGRAAGYGLTGFEILSAVKTPERCAAFLSDVRMQCDAVSGSVVRADDCQDLCSTPIAEPGKVAGFDLVGFRILPANDAGAEACPAFITDVAVRCGEAGGVTTRTLDCNDLCSLPLTPAR